MLISFNKQNHLKDIAYFSNYKDKSSKKQRKSEIHEYNNTIYYPFAGKEWFTSIYSYIKSYIKPLISSDAVLNKLFKSYCNMLEDKIKTLFKRRRNKKIRYSADKIYVSRAELDHTNTDISITFYLYNKKKSSIERSILR
jgi:hypothetical protein